MVASLKLRRADITSLPAKVLSHEPHRKPDHHRGHRPVEIGKGEVVHYGSACAIEFLLWHNMVNYCVFDGLGRGCDMLMIFVQ